MAGSWWGPAQFLDQQISQVCKGADRAQLAIEAGFVSAGAHVVFQPIPLQPAAANADVLAGPFVSQSQEGPDGGAERRLGLAAATDRTFSLGLERAKAKSAAELESARIQSQENVQLLQLLLEAQRTLAQIFSQMGASMMSAMSYSASLSGSVSNSTSFSFSGEV